MSEHFELKLLGGFELRWGGTQVTVPLAAQRLLAYLALQPRARPRTLVAGVLWPDTTDAKAGANLRSTLWRLHQLPAEPVAVSRSNLALAAGTEVDVERMLAIAGALRGAVGGDGLDELPLRDLGGLAAELLPDLWDEWLVFERERLRQVTLHALEAASRLLSTRGEHTRAVLAGLAAVEADPLRETANRVLVEAYLGEGNLAEAVRQYRRFRALLLAELDAEPHPSFAALVAVPSATRSAGAAVTTP